MMRIGKRILLKFGALSIIIFLVTMAIMSVYWSKRALATEQDSSMQLLGESVVSHGKQSGRHDGGNIPMRLTQKLSPHRVRAKGEPSVEWKSHGDTKSNITREFVSRKRIPGSQLLLNASKNDGQRQGARSKVQQRKEEIRRVRDQLQEKKVRRQEELRKLSSKTTHSVNGTCRPHGNVAYIKTHKTASTTLQTIINRFGLLNKLSFVLNKISPTNGHFVYLPVTKHSPRYFFLPPLGVGSNDFSQFQYNMIAVHLRYNRSAMDSFMLPGTKYITIIREPSSHFESAFSHFRFNDSFSAATRCRVKGHEIEEFMRRPGYYRRRLKKMPWDTNRGLRWYYARNNQIFDLGLDSKYHNDEAIVTQTVEDLEKELDLVLISEYFDESLVLLKKLLCWTFDDIIYIAKNQRVSRVEMNADTRLKIREWSHADTILYERCNRTLWRKIQEYGPDFARDLAYFRKRKDAVFKECAGEEIMRSHGVFKHREFTPNANSSLFCTLVAESKTRLFQRVWLRQAGVWGTKLRESRIKSKAKREMAKKLAEHKRRNDTLSLQEPNKQVKSPVEKRSSEKESATGAEEPPVLPKRDAKSQIECKNIAQEVNINFESSDGNGLIFPEET